VRLDHQALGFERGQAGVSSCDLRGAGEVDGIARAADVRRLVTHRCKDLRAESGVARGARHPQRLYEVALRDSMFLEIVGGPARQLRELGSGGEQLPPDALVVAAAQQWGNGTV
jgi:hypothetical protein